jgi:hypothetical protein
MKAEKVVETKNIAQQGEAAAKAVAAMIGQASQAGQLIAESEILRRVADPHLLTSPAAKPGEQVGNILKKVVDGSEDLQELTAQDGSRHYYSPQFMTQAYALMLLQKQGDPLRLIAEIVRQNSQVYPRPVPLDIFTQPPFDLTRQEVLNDLDRMAAEEEYRDIVPTTTSASRVFLYSTLHLEPGHASMLAEWIDVGQFNNP